jgi:glycine/D-amino acid oxidase-like deaminating enzyme
MYSHLFQHGICVFCGKPVEFMRGATSWRGGWCIAPNDEECKEYEKWHVQATLEAKES